MAAAKSLSIGILTGTFDPIHLGHIALARAAIVNMGLDEVWLMVNEKRINSAIEDKAAILSLEHRLAMARLAALGESGIKVYDGPLLTRPHNIATFLELMRQFPQGRFVFVVGTDTIARLDGWKDVETVVSKASFAVAVRPNTPDNILEHLKQRLGRVGGSLSVDLFRFDDHAKATSTRIRKEMKEGNSSADLSEPVRQYITIHELYR